jgi:3-dehydroquinate dehydratase-1
MMSTIHLDTGCAIDAAPRAEHHSVMSKLEFSAAQGTRRVVGGFGSPADLAQATVATVAADCDLVEIRLDLLADGAGTVKPAAWQHLRGLPLLFTARRGDEGGAGNLDAATRIALLSSALEDAACIDVEVASIDEVRPLLGQARARGIPWIASFHDFVQTPEPSVLQQAALRAREAGAAVLKIAAMTPRPADLTRLAEFQLADHGLPLATMGMGPLAAVSRLLCAQCGSVLNYGFLGSTPTAPGQWHAAWLKQAIGRLAPFPG